MLRIAKSLFIFKKLAGVISTPESEQVCRIAEKRTSIFPDNEALLPSEFHNTNLV